MCYTSDVLGPNAGSSLTPASLAHLSHRRRGAQPGNHNALKHGVFAAASQLPAALTHTQLDLVPAPSQTSLDMLQGALFRADRIMTEALELMETSAQPMFGMGCVAYSCALRLFALASMLRLRFALPGQYLTHLAVHCSQLLDWEFRRIPESALFVPLTLGNFDANSSRGGPVLTDAQWLVLRDVFGSLHAELNAKRRYRRRKPLPDDRLLFRGILLKLAFGLRWRDLAALGFKPRLCRTRYRQLYLSGRMSAIYTHLHRHLVVCGDTRLEGLVEQRFFKWQYGFISLSPGQPFTWRTFTALLLLQRAQRSQRALARRSDLLRRRGGAYLRFPLPRLSHFTTDRLLSTPGGRQRPPRKSTEVLNDTSFDFGGRDWVGRFRPVLESVASAPFP